MLWPDRPSISSHQVVQDDFQKKIIMDYLPKMMFEILDSSQEDNTVFDIDSKITKPLDLLSDEVK